MSLRLSKIFFPSSIFALTAIVFLLNVNHVRAAGYVSLSKDIDRWQTLVAQVQNDHGSYSHYLIEPYTQLARAQLSGSRLEDARASVGKAIHNSRINSGLHSAEQIPLQKLAIEIDSMESDWRGVEEKLIALVSLVTGKSQLKPKQVIEQLQWVSHIRELAVQEDTEDRLAIYIINNTLLSEYMVVIAQQAGLTGSDFYLKLLHSLANQYYLETKAIIAGGDTSLRLRVTNLDLNFVDSHQEAIEKRYLAGLDKLQMIKDLIDNPVALAFSELHIADWKAMFNRSEDSGADYENVYERFTNTSADRHQIDNLFATNKVLPAANLQLDFYKSAGTHLVYAASTSTKSPAAISSTTGESNARNHVQVAEMNKHLPGYRNPMLNQENEDKLVGSWNAISAIITLDPHKRKIVRSSDYRVKSFVTGKKIDILDNGQIQGRELRRTASRIKALSFRPIIRDGKVKASTVLVDYLFRSNELYTDKNLVVLR
ncbi:MAG: hypothetical protein ACI945_001744 [Pseudohongiellaceae bacterium]|jgi:hypothetical protein